MNGTITDTAPQDALADCRPAEEHRRAVHRWCLLGLAVVFAVAPLAIYPVFLMKVMCFALFAMAFNLLLGFGGLMSFGHAAFFGVGCYGAASAAKLWGWPPECALLAGVAASLFLGGAFGALAIRRQGIYFAMITLALAQMVYFGALRAKFTGGENGIQNVPRGFLLGIVDLSSDTSLYMVVLAVFMAAILIIYRVMFSPFGQVLRSIRDNEARATSLGYKPDAHRLAVFMISAGLSGLAGGLKAMILQFATLTDVHWSMSGEVVLMVLLGGIGTVFGPVVGAAIVVAMQDYFASLGSWVTVVQGMVFVLTVSMFRSGVVGTLAKRFGMPL